MLNQPPPMLVALLLGSAGLSFFLASWAWQHRRTNGGLEMALMLGAVAIYTLGYSFEISRPDLEGAIAAIRFEYIGSAWVPPLFFAFAWRYTRERPLPLPLVVFIVLEALSTLAVVWSPWMTSLFYASLRMDMSPPFPTIQYQPGPWFTAHYYLMELEGMVGALLLLWGAFRADPAKRLQNLIIALGALFPLAATIGFLLGLTPERIDVTPIALSLTGLVCSIALLKLDVLEIVPAARALAIDSLSDGFIVTDEKGRIRDANGAARALLESKLPRGASLLPGSSGLHGSCTPLLSLAQAGTGASDFITAARDGGARHLSASAQPVMDRGKRRGTVILLHDATETVKLMDSLKELARRDQLTGLFNRRYIMELGLRELELGSLEHYPVGAIMVGIDFLKHVNDDHGRPAGDKVLAETARRLAASVRSIDLVGRYSGDKFVILMPGTDGGQLMKAAEHIRLAISRTLVEWGRFVLPVSASIGIAVAAPGSCGSLGELLVKADAALAEAKKAGRNCVKAAGA
jgi:diguanylate cyclase (GGDEF)-like protein